MKTMIQQTNKVPEFVPLGGWAKTRGRKPKGMFFPFGISGLDEKLGGAWSHQMTLVGGPPGDGKTSLAMQWLLHNAEKGIPAGMMSLEMPKRDIEVRLLSAKLGVDFKTLMTGSLTKAQHAAMLKAAAELAKLPLHVDDRSGMTADDIYETLTTWHKRGVKVAVVDFLQYAAGSSDSKSKTVEDAGQAAKNAAKDTGLAVLALSSLNRNASHRTSKVPNRSDIRDSGALEFTSDIILMFEYPNEDSTSNNRLCNLHIMKNKQGGKGHVPLTFVAPEFRFKDRFERQRGSVESNNRGAK